MKTTQTITTFKTPTELLRSGLSRSFSVNVVVKQPGGVSVRVLNVLGTMKDVEIIGVNPQELAELRDVLHDVCEFLKV